MPDQKFRSLKDEARRVLQANELLDQTKPSQEWTEWGALFETARHAYPPRVFWIQGAPATIEEWIFKTAEAKGPRPNVDDMNRLLQAEDREPDGEESVFYRRWYRLVRYADEVLQRAADAPMPSPKPDHDRSRDRYPSPDADSPPAD